MGLTMFSAQAKQKIEEELSRAADARANGLEGRARVGARRAAGAAVREYLRLREGGEAVTGTAYDLLAALQDLPAVPEQARKSAALLLERVDENYALPPEIDLLAEARRLADSLENQGTE